VFLVYTDQNRARIHIIGVVHEFYTDISCIRKEYMNHYTNHYIHELIHESIVYTEKVHEPVYGYLVYRGSIQTIIEFVHGRPRVYEAVHEGVQEAYTRSVFTEHIYELHVFTGEVHELIHDCIVYTEDILRLIYGQVHDLYSKPYSDCIRSVYEFYIRNPHTRNHSYIRISVYMNLVYTKL
jgi:hypothetical protein